MINKLNTFKRRIQRYRNIKKWIKRNNELYSNMTICPLTNSERQEVMNKWKGINLSHCWKDFDVLKTICGYNQNLIPISVFDTFVIPALNPLHDRKALANKAMNFYLQDVNTPEFIARSIGGVIYDKDNKLLTKEELLTMLKDIEEEIVLKQGQDSSGGQGVVIAKFNELNINEVLKNFGETYIIQRRVHQSMWFNSLNDTSINTIRCTTLLLEDGPHLVSAQLKISHKGAKVDNASFGSVFVGINANGMLEKYGYKKGLVKVFEQNGKKFGGLMIPQWDRIKQFVISNALKIPACKVIGWDIAVGEDEEPILIEANLNCPGVTIEQACSGPIFGKYTDDVIRLVSSHLEKV